MDKDAVALLISFYAAILSTAVFVWSIITHLKDKGRIKIGGFFGHKVDGFTKPQKMLYFEFVNVGSKPIFISNFGGSFKKKDVVNGKTHFVVNIPGIPVRLEPGDRHQITLDRYDVVDQRVKKMYAIDTTGKEHYMSGKLLRSLIEQKKSFNILH